MDSLIEILLLLPARSIPSSSILYTTPATKNGALVKGYLSLIPTGKLLRTILITGGAGFVGSNIAKLLIKEGGKSGLWTNPDGLPKFLENIF